MALASIAAGLCLAAGPASARSLSIKDPRLLTGSQRCPSDLIITATGNDYTFEKGSKGFWSNGELQIWCPGARHTWKGVSVDIAGGAIRRIESDEKQPLVFEVTKAGYQYRRGRGVVVLADGSTIELPSGPRAAAVTAETAAEPGTFAGTATCGGMLVSVQMNVGADGRVTGFEAKHQCKGEKTGMSWSPDAPMSIDHGRFEYQDAWGNSVAGKVDGKEAQGTFGKGVPSVECADKKFHEACLAWRASWRPSP